VLESGKKFSAPDMLALQTDIYSDFDHFVSDKLVYAVDHTKDASARTKSAADILRQWDGRMTADSAAPTLAVRAREELVRLLLEPKLGPASRDKGTLSWTSYSWMMETIWLDNVLQRHPAAWLPSKYPSYDEVLAAALEAAVSRPDAPADLSRWKWGGVNSLEIQNPVLGKIPLLSHWTGTGTNPQSGSGYTVKAVTGRTGPSERITDDLSNFDQSTFNLVTGEAGGFLSPYYLDEWNAWYNGTTFAWPFSESATKASQQHTLTLAPSQE
jgi:penicillin amidase